MYVVKAAETTFARNICTFNIAADPIIFFLPYRRISLLFVAKQGHFTISDFLYMQLNTQTKQQK